MNETLEEMARTIFKNWFVDFDPVHVKFLVTHQHIWIKKQPLSQIRLAMMVCRLVERKIYQIFSILRWGNLHLVIPTTKKKKEFLFGKVVGILASGFLAIEFTARRQHVLLMKATLLSVLELQLVM